MLRIYSVVLAMTMLLIGSSSDAHPLDTTDCTRNHPTQAVTVTAEKPNFITSGMVSVIPGCMDREARNFNPAATADDGSCVYTQPASVTCGKGETRDCIGRCWPGKWPEAYLGNGICDANFGCEAFDFDLGDCAIGTPLGDITGDDVADQSDVQCGMEIAGWEALNPADDPPRCLAVSPRDADINCDGTVNVADAVLLGQYAAGISLHPTIDADGDQIPDACVVESAEPTSSPVIDEGNAAADGGSTTTRTPMIIVTDNGTTITWRTVD